MRRTAVLAVAAAVIGVGACSSKGPEHSVRIAAASDLTLAFEELGKAFEKQTKIHPVFDFGSSGLLAKQIEQGAPYYLFAAANRDYAEQVVKAGRCDGSSLRSYAQGRIVVWTASGTVAPVKLADLTEPRFKRIAIANPDHAPYGRAAKQALEKAGLWEPLQDRLVFGDSIQSTMQYARRHEVDAAIVALSLATVADGGAFLPIDQSQYDPLDQVLVVCGNGEEADAARRFVEFVNSPDGREVMIRYGFLLPDEQLHSSK